MHELIWAFIVAFILSIVLHFVISRSKSHDTCQFPTSKNVLLIIAHPDDECMFFGPSIQTLKCLGNIINILCMTSGNYYKKGSVRKEELLASCDILGVESNKVTIIEDSNIEDSPDILWNTKLVGKYITSTVEREKIDTVMTFDSYGVSGHPNHKALFHACRYLRLYNKIRSDIPIYVLESVNIFRKYISIFDVPSSYMFSFTCFVSSWAEMGVAKHAMKAHASQMLWFRHLYIIFSRYMLMNTLMPLEQTTEYKKSMQEMQDAGSKQD